MPSGRDACTQCLIKHTDAGLIDCSALLFPISCTEMAEVQPPPTPQTPLSQLSFISSLTFPAEHDPHHPSLRLKSLQDQVQGEVQQQQQQEEEEEEEEEFIKGV